MFLPSFIILVGCRNLSLQSKQQLAVFDSKTWWNILKRKKFLCDLRSNYKV